MRRNQNLAIIFLFVTICGLGYQFLLSRKPLVALYPVKLSEQDIREVSSALTTLKIEHNIDLELGIVVHPDEKLEAQSKLAEMKLPRVYSRPHSPKPSRESEVEQELAERIGALPKVEEVSVRVTLSTKNYFRDDPQPSARVSIRLEEDEELSRAELLQINQLVQSAIPLVKWEKVHIVDSTGRKLSPRYEL